MEKIETQLSIKYILVALALLVLVSSMSMVSVALASSNGYYKYNRYEEKYISKNQLPANAQDYLKQSFNGVTVVKVERDNNYYKVELRNGMEIKFDINGNFLYKEMDDDRYNNDRDDDYHYKYEHNRVSSTNIETLQTQITSLQQTLQGLLQQLITLLTVRL